MHFIINSIEYKKVNFDYGDHLWKIRLIFFLYLRGVHRMQMLPYEADKSIFFQEIKKGQYFDSFQTKRAKKLEKLSLK